MKSIFDVDKIKIIFKIMCMNSKINNNSNNSIGYIQGGTSYGSDGAEMYAKTKHGPDGAWLLDQDIIPFVTENIQDLNLLDAGCGAAPWAVLAGLKGANVYGIDIQERMIELGNDAVNKAGLQDKVKLQIGDVNQLPYKNNFFDKAICINVGCNLPSSVKVDGNSSDVGITKVIKEISRVLNVGGRALITTPASYDILFTAKGRKRSEIEDNIQSVVTEINKEKAGPEFIVNRLNSLHDVLRAVFIENNHGDLELLKDKNQLKEGCKIWYKLPGAMTVPNYYHSEEIYKNAGTEASLELVSIIRPLFENKEKLTDYNITRLENNPALGDEYVGHNIFTLFEFEKRQNLSPIRKSS